MKIETKKFESNTNILSYQVETDITDITKRVNELAGIKESDTGLGPPALWDLAADKQTLQSEQPLQVQAYLPFNYQLI